MTTVLPIRTRNSICNGIISTLDQGSAVTNNYIEFHSGTRPSPDAAASNSTLLVTLQFSQQSFNSPNNGIIKANPILNGTVVKTGIATWFRIYDKDRNAVIDGDISGLTGSGDIKLDNVELIAGGILSISSLIGIVPQ